MNPHPDHERLRPLTDELSHAILMGGIEPKAQELNQYRPPEGKSEEEWSLGSAMNREQRRRAGQRRARPVRLKVRRRG